MDEERNTKPTAVELTDEELENTVGGSANLDTPNHIITVTIGPGKSAETEIRQALADYAAYIGTILGGMQQIEASIIYLDKEENRSKARKCIIHLELAYANGVTGSIITTREELC